MGTLIRLFVITVMIATASMIGLANADMGKGGGPLMTAPGSKAEAHNKEGIEHYNQGHWDVAKKHFEAAAKEDPKSAEAHYNLALTLDKAGDHKGATEHFKTAWDLGQSNPEIQNSAVLKAHVKKM